MATTYSSTSVLVVRWADSPPAGPAVERIIVPLDGSELATKALDPAKDLARRTGAHVSLMTTRGADDDDTADYLDEAAARLDGISTEIVHRAERDPVEAIAALLADSQESTWIVMSSHGRGRLAQAVLGSVAERIIAEIDAPVVVVGPAYDPQLHFTDGPVIVAHDAVHPPDAGVTSVLCKAADTRAVVLEVNSGPLQKSPHSDEPMPSPLISLWVESLRERGIEAAAEVRPGPSVPRAAADEAHEIGASFIVVTSRAQTGMRRFILGSHTAGTVRHSPVPVVVLRAAADTTGS